MSLVLLVILVYHQLAGLVPFLALPFLLVIQEKRFDALVASLIPRIPDSFSLAVIPGVMKVQFSGPMVLLLLAMQFAFAIRVFELGETLFEVHHASAVLEAFLAVVIGILFGVAEPFLLSTVSLSFRVTEMHPQLSSLTEIFGVPVKQPVLII